MSPHQHAQQLSLPLLVKTALARVLAGVIEGSEDDVPTRQVGIIAAVMRAFVMTPMAFRALKHESKPIRRAYIAVIKQLGNPRDRNDDCRGVGTEAHDDVQNEARQNAIE